MRSVIHRRRAPRWAVLAAATLAASGSGAAALGNATRVSPVVLAAETQRDARDAQGPLDLLDAVLVQRDVRMSLRIRTSGTWKAADVTGAAGRSLCVTLAHGAPAIARGRVCVTVRERHPTLSYTPLRADGTAGATRPLAAVLSRPSSNVMQASFLPVAAGLPVGDFSWFAHSSWTDRVACPATCADRIPDAGAVGGRVALVGFVRCFGAAARDPQRRCENPVLRRAVEPPPESAQITLDPFCDNRHNPSLSICSFGAVPADATATFAVVGDSHASSLKTALHVVALGRRWRGVSMVRAACPATQARKPILPTRARSAQCVRWNRQVLDWLAAHPEVDTVFLSTSATAEVGRVDGRPESEVIRAGYRDEIALLLRRVKRVVVIRDMPMSAPGHLRCVSRALGAGRSPGRACARPRRAALLPDPLVEVARALDSSRVRVVDLTDHMCDAKRCFPVVGGALVHRDESHLTPAFSATLGPFILRALDG
jgi:hypothetical protein